MAGTLTGYAAWFLLFIIQLIGGEVPTAVVILGRDVLLSLSAFYIRYTSLPEPVRNSTFIILFLNLIEQKTFSRYWDFSLPSAEIRPTAISKVSRDRR